MEQRRVPVRPVKAAPGLLEDFVWTFDRRTNNYRNIGRIETRDGGGTWEEDRALYVHGTQRAEHRKTAYGEAWTEMGKVTAGHPFVTRLSGGQLLAIHYAGPSGRAPREPAGGRISIRNGFFQRGDGRNRTCQRHRICTITRNSACREAWGC